MPLLASLLALRHEASCSTAGADDCARRAEHLFALQTFAAAACTYSALFRRVCVPTTRLLATMNASTGEVDPSNPEEDSSGMLRGPLLSLKEEEVAAAARQLIAAGMITYEEPLYQVLALGDGARRCAGPG